MVVNGERGKEATSAVAVGGGGGDYQWMTLGKILRNHDDCGGVRSLQYVVLVIVSIRCLRTHRSLGGGRGKIKYRIGGG